MNYSIIRKLTPVEEIIQAYPLSLRAMQKVAQDRREVKDILEGKDKRLLMIVGPCSAWPKAAVLEYAQRLAVLNDKLQDALKIIMRVYIQKPRTTKGWTGPVNQPDPLSSPDIEAGMRYVRDMMIQVIDLGLPIADEALFTHNAKGFVELLTWVAIGARSAEDQEHRIFASSIACAVGMKNPTNGSIAIGANSVVAAQHPHIAVLDGCEVQTHGNQHAHLVLRGGYNGPNYAIECLEEAKRALEQHAVENPAVIIDASHDNCIVQGKKDYRRQTQVVEEVLDSIAAKPPLKNLIKGFMLESFIQEGNQKVEKEDAAAIDLTGLSITDPCLSWEQTEAFLLRVAKRVAS